MNVPANQEHEQEHEKDRMMTKQVIQTEHAPAAVGPYSQGMIANGFIFTAGQIARLPSGGNLFDQDVQTQARQVLANLEAVLSAGGSSLKSVVKTTIYLQSMNDFAAVNAVYSEVFSALGTPFPARSTVEVAKLPLGAQVEIEVIALLEEGTN